MYLIPLVALSACRGVIAENPSHNERALPFEVVERDASVVAWRRTAESTDAGAITDVTASRDTAVVTDTMPDVPRVIPPTVANCEIFPIDNPWNQDIRALPVHPNSAGYLSAMNASEHLQPEWGDWSTNEVGIPINTGRRSAPVPMSWSAPWGDTESDPEPCADGSSAFCYPIPSSANIEGGPGSPTTWDRHLIYLDTSGAPQHCVLYEIYNAQDWSGPGWCAANGAIFHLDSNALRPDGWTSADEAGLSVLAGLVRVDEVLAGEIRHALRFTMSDTGNGFIHPATHGAGPGTPNVPPMGLRLRLRASFDASSFDAASRVIVLAMQRYGIILADTGPDWFITGDSDDRWTPLYDGIAAAFEQIHGSDFEVVYTGEVQTVQQ